MKLNEWSRLFLIAVCIVSALTAFNLPEKYDAMEKYLLHVKLLSLSFLALGVFAFLSVLYNTILCIGSGLVVAMILNWFISSWFFNPFEMGTNQIVMGWVLSIVLAVAPLVIAIRSNFRKNNLFESTLNSSM
jgi:Na+/H+-translocating membrane pyrophosphatase